MARDLSVQAGVDNSDPANYPNGVILNNATVVGEEIQGDAVQFWMKVLRLAAITPNTLPDNETNGFQLLTALEKVIHPDIEDSIITSVLGSATLGVVTFSKHSINGNNIVIQSSFQVSTGNAQTLQIQYDIGFSGVVGQNIDFVVNGVREVGKVISTTPLIIEKTGSLPNATYDIEIFGTLIGS